jgi:hypothetical protein
MLRTRIDACHAKIDEGIPLCTLNQPGKTVASDQSLQTASQEMLMSESHRWRRGVMLLAKLPMASLCARVQATETKGHCQARLPVTASVPFTMCVTQNTANGNKTSKKLDSTSQAKRRWNLAILGRMGPDTGVARSKGLPNDRFGAASPHDTAACRPPKATTGAAFPAERRRGESAVGWIALRTQPN